MNYVTFQFSVLGQAAGPQSPNASSVDGQPRRVEKVFCYYTRCCSRQQSVCQIGKIDKSKLAQVTNYKVKLFSDTKHFVQSPGTTISDIDRPTPSGRNSSVRRVRF